MAYNQHVAFDSPEGLTVGDLFQLVTRLKYHGAPHDAKVKGRLKFNGEVKAINVQFSPADPSED